jgi:hypothetical protein
VRHLPRLLPLITAFACAHGDQKDTSAEKAPQFETVADIRKGVDELLRLQSDLYWKNWVQGEEVDIARTYRGRESLFTPDAIAKVKAAEGAAAGDERKALLYLRQHLIGEHLARETAGASLRVAAEGAATFTWDGKEVAVRDLSAMLAAEPEAPRRRAIERAAATAVAKVGPALEERGERITKTARGMGFAGALPLAAFLRGAEPAALAASANALLEATEGTYRALLDDLAPRELGMPRQALRRRDAPRLMRGSLDAKGLPGEVLVAEARALFAGMGLDLAAMPGVKLDVEQRPRKNPRAITLPVSIPGDVRVSLLPAAGVESYRSTFHELAHAAHFALVKSSVPEFRRLGPVATVESFGMLFEGVLEDKGWLGSRPALTGPAAEHMGRASLARRLYLARHHAAQVLFELARTNKPTQAPQLYAQIFSRAYAHPIESNETGRWTQERDELLHAADLMRAALLAAQMESYLGRLGATTASAAPAAAAAPGPAWWSTRQSGEWLRRVWAKGSQPTPEELSREMGYPALDAEALAALARSRAETLGVRPIK